MQEIVDWNTFWLSTDKLIITNVPNTHTQNRLSKQVPGNNTHKQTVLSMCQHVAVQLTLHWKRYKMDVFTEGNVFLSPLPIDISREHPRSLRLHRRWSTSSLSLYLKTLHPFPIILKKHVFYSFQHCYLFISHPRHHNTSNVDQVEIDRKRTNP